MIPLCFALFGALIGSFLNVVVIRHGTRSLSGRSFCDSCGYTLHWYNLVPVLSWIVQRGRCSECGTRVSIQYPLVEAFTALAFFIVALADLSLGQQVLLAAIVAILIAISVYDIRHTIIPDSWTALCAALAFVFGAWVFMPMGEEWLVYLLSGPATALPLFALWFVSRGRWMGFGDVKLALVLGWLLGLYWGTVALFGAFIIGAIVSVCILLPLPYIIRLVTLHSSALGDTEASFTMKSEVPFGPFLVCSCFIVLYSQYVLAVPLPAIW